MGKVKLDLSGTSFENKATLKLDLSGTSFEKKNPNQNDTVLSGRIDSTAGKSSLSDNNSAWYDWDNIKKAGTNLIYFGKGLGQEIPSETTRMIGDLISSFGLTVDLGGRYSSAGINYLMGDKKQAQKDIDSDPTFLGKYLVDAGNYLSESADQTKDDTLKNWGVSEKNRSPQRSFYDAFSDGDLVDGSAMLFRDVLATVPQVAAAVLSGGGSLEAQALRKSGGLLRQTALSEMGAIASTELPAILSTGLKSQTGAQFKFGMGLGTTSSLAAEYKKDNHITATDFLESIARGVIEGASESLFDTDILAAKKLASKFVNVSDNPAIKGIMASIVGEGEDAAKDKIVRTTTDILGKAFAGGRNEGLEEVASSFGNMLIDATKQGGFTIESLDKFKRDAIESFIVGSLSGGVISGGAARMSRVKLTDVQQKTIDRYNEVINDDSVSDEAKGVAKERIKNILDYNASLSKDNYGLIAALPKEKRAEALGYLSSISKLEEDIKNTKDSEGGAFHEELGKDIKSYEDKVNKLIEDEYKTQRETRRKETMSQSDIDTEDIINFFQTKKQGFSIEGLDNSLTGIRAKVNNKEEIDQWIIDSANDTLYRIIDNIEKSELTAEQKKVASEPFFNQIQQLESYDKTIKTTEVTTPVNEVTTTTREIGRRERPKTTVMTDRLNLEPVEVTDSGGNKSNYIAKINEDGSISLVPKVKFSRTATEQKRKGIELDYNFLEFQESIKDENDRVVGAKLLDKKTGNTIEISNPELAIDLATKAKQDALGNVSEGVMFQEKTVTPIGQLTSIVKEFVNKRTTKVAPQATIETAEGQAPALITEVPTSPVGLPSRRAYVVEDDVETKKGNKILNKISPEIKKRIANYVKSLKATIPNSTVVLYDNKADMIEGLVNQGYSRQEATTAVNESDGLYAGSSNTIHIDVMRMDKTTLPHEIFHPLVARLAKENPAEFIALRKRISKVLSKSQLKELDAFAAQYADEGKAVEAEEFLSQLGGLVTVNKAKMERGTLMKLALAVKEFLDKIAAKTNSKVLESFANSIFTEQTKTDDLIKFFEGFGRSLRQGEAINVEGLNLTVDGFLSPEGDLRQQKIASVKNIDVKEIRTLSRAGNRISKGLSVSTKNGKKVVQEAEDLSLEYVKANAPELFIANSNIIANYPLVSGIVGEGNITTLDRAQEVYDVFSREVANNLEYLMDNFNENYKDVSTLWYDGANILAQDLSKKYGVTTEQVAGIMASLSPQKDWYQNVRLAEMVLMAHEENPVMSKEMIEKQKSIAKEGLTPVKREVNKAKKAYEAAKKNVELVSENKESTKQDISAAKQALKDSKEKLSFANDKYNKNLNNSNRVIDSIAELIGKRMYDVPNEMKGYYTRLWNEVNVTKNYDVLRPDGQIMGIALTKKGEKAMVAWGSYTEINKANAIYLDGSQENITRSLGEMHKIRNFYNNIIDPMSKDQDVTMDTHAIAAALLMPLSGNSKQVGQNFGTGTKNSSPLGIKGLYYAYAEGYKLAANETNLLPRQVQSITWEAIRGLFTATFKNSKQNVAKVESIWNNYATNKISIDETRNQIDEFAGGIKDPTWARPIQERGTEDTQQGDVGRGVDGAGQGVVGESTRDRLNQQKNAEYAKIKDSIFGGLPANQNRLFFADISKETNLRGDSRADVVLMFDKASMWLSEGADGYVTLDDFQVYDDAIGTGKGSTALNKLLQYADSNEITILADIVSPELRNRMSGRKGKGKGLTQKQLVDFYKKRGFKKVSKQALSENSTIEEEYYERTPSDLRQKKTYPDAFEESRNEYLDKFKNTPKEVSRYLRKVLFERNINVKKAFEDAELEFSLYTMYNKAGASMFGNLKFTEKFNEIYENLSTKEIKLLDNFILLRRTVAIDTNFDNREESRPEHPDHKNIDGVKTATNKESALSTLEDYKDLLGDELYNKIYNSSDKYFKAFSDILKYKYDNGLINKETYELYKDYNYSPRKFLQFMFGTSISEESKLTSNNFYQRGLALSKDELSKIQSGSTKGLFVDSAKLLHAAMIATEVRVASNLALKTLYNEAIPANLDFVKEVEYEKYQDGTIKINPDGSLKYVKTADEGFRIVTFKEDGIVKAFQLKEDLAKEYFDEELFDKNSKAYKFAQIASGSNILRNMATGMNLAFFVTNIPVDALSQVQFSGIHDGASLGAAGQFASAITGTLIKSGQILPLEFGFKNKAIEDLIYEYGKAGGLMMTLTEEYSSKAKFLGNIPKYLGSFGNASEMGSKLNAYEKVRNNEIKKYKDQNGKEPIGEDLTKIQTKAAYIARAAMDYHRGGLLTKWIDGFIPYLNVLSQATKITADYIVKNPKDFTDKITQMGIFVIGLTIYNLMVAGSDYDNDDNEQDLLTKIVVFSPFKDADGKRGKIEIGAPDMVKKFLNIFQSIGEGIYYQAILGEKQKIDEWKIEKRAQYLSSFDLKLPSNIPPALKAMVEYKYNLDLWRNKDITKQLGDVLPQDEGRYNPSVASFYKIIGSSTGMSPIRLQKASENFITQSNPLVGIGYSLMDKMVNNYANLPESQRSKYDKGNISDIPLAAFDKIAGRIMSKTDPTVTYTKGKDIIDRINQTAGSKKQEAKAEMKLLVEKKASVAELNEFLINQDPIYRKAAVEYRDMLQKKAKLNYPDFQEKYYDIMLGQNAEAKAQIIYTYFPYILNKGNEKLIKDLNELNLVGKDTEVYLNKYVNEKGIKE